MEDLHLTDTEQRYFGDLFLCCDEESTGKIPILKATELFRSSNIPNDVLKQISELSFPQSNSTSLTHINRKQFYSALKLIAAHQANMPLRGDLLTTSVDLPLPRFTWNLKCETTSDLIQLSTSPTLVAPKEQHIHKRDKSFGLYEPITLSANSSDMDVPQTGVQHDHLEAQSTDSEIESETISQRSEHSHTLRAKNGSPWSTGSESPTPTNSVAERGVGVGSQGPPGGRWPQPHIGEEHTQLLGTEEESSDRHSSDDEGIERESDAHSSVWRIASDQRRHYTAQFNQLHPDSRGFLPGTVARHFFEKSRLSVTDLRKIWLLSDVTKDGALCLEEFITAMHLIVLRRNEIPIPDVLPSCLVPKSRKASHASPEQVITSNLVDLGSNCNINLVGEFNPKVNNMSSSIIKVSKHSDAFDGKTLKNLEDSSPSLSPLSVDSCRVKPEPMSANKEWTKFIDSPTCSISSPGPKPVNFDFHKASVEKDPKIFHPVPLRVTPECSSIPVQSNESGGGTSPRKLDEPSYHDSQDVSSPKKLSGQLSVENHSSVIQSSVSEIKPIQRPQAKKTVLKSIGAIPPPPAKDWSAGASEEASGPMSLQYAPVPKKEPPPPPPPRPLRTHTRSSSLDLNKLKDARTSNSNQPAPPQVPPRVSPSLTSPHKKLINQRSEGDVFEHNDAFTQSASAYETKFKDESQAETFANFALFQNNLPLPGNEYSAVNLPTSRASFEDDSSSSIPRKHGAFEIYRKPTPRNSQSPDTATGVDTVGSDPLKKLQEQNSLLCRLCKELNLELADVQRERETLRLRLESNMSSV